MSYDKVKESRHLSIGTNHAMRTVELGKAAEVLVAKDADQRLTMKMVSLCANKGVAVTYVDSMKMLGKACGIEVGAAMVALVNEG